MERDNRVPFNSSFEGWMYQLDLRLLWYAGVTTFELRIKPQAWRLLWERGWGVHAIADALAGWSYQLDYAA